MPASASVFLMYHELELPNRHLCQSEPGYLRYVISEQEFREQMAAIRESGLQGLSVTDALTFSTPAVAITVDDGCETDLLAIAPILKQFEFGATFYVVAGFLDKRGYLSVSQLRELNGLGFEIGCHSMTHPYLSDLDDASLQREITDSKKALEQILGKSRSAFKNLCRGSGLWKLQLRVGMRDSAKRMLGNSAYDRVRAILLRG